MLKRQESSLSSSRRLAAAAAASTPPLREARHAKPIGCMSGIFQLFSKYQNSSKRLTFGRKREKCKPSSQAKDKGETTKDSLSSAEEDKTESQNIRLSLEINLPRSPPEIRLSNAVKSPENPRTPSSVVAKLMGLGDMNTTVKMPALEETDSVSEKRRQLIRALEKCNEDLEGLRRIIQAVQANDIRLQPPSPVAAKSDRPGSENDELWAENSCIEKCAAVGAEARIPMAVSGFAEAQNTVCSAAKTPACRLPHRKPPTASKKPGKDDTESIVVLLMRSRRSPPIATSPRCSSSTPKARTIEEVCKDIAWGEQREMGRIVVVLQDYICRDLVEEVVKELKSCRVRYSLPLEGCKRRLSF